MSGCLWQCWPVAAARLGISAIPRTLKHNGIKLTSIKYSSFYFKSDSVIGQWLFLINQYWSGSSKFVWLTFGEVNQSHTASLFTVEIINFRSLKNIKTYIRSSKLPTVQQKMPNVFSSPIRNQQFFICQGNQTNGLHWGINPLAESIFHPQEIGNISLHVCLSSVSFRQFHNPVTCFLMAESWTLLSLRDTFKCIAIYLHYPCD